MARGIPFDEANTILRAPTAEDAAAGTVYDLHVLRLQDLDRNWHCVSKWQFTPEELADVIANDGEFWFKGWGATHPPICVMSEPPFDAIEASLVTVPGRLSINDEGFDPALGAVLSIKLDGQEVLGAIAYDIEAGTVTRYVYDERGQPQLDDAGENVRIETVSGTVEVTATPPARYRLRG